MGKGSRATVQNNSQQQQSSTTARPDDQAYQLYSQLLQQAQTAASRPYTPYGGELTAGMNAQQNQGIANINSTFPMYGQAAQQAQSASQPLTAQQIQQYQSPYTQQVVDATQNQFNNQNDRQLQQNRGNAIAQGALGGNRRGIAEGVLANQQQLGQAPVIAGLYNSGYQNAVNTAQGQQQIGLQGAQGLMGIANSQLGAANNQIGAGTLQQQTQQAGNNAQYQQFMQQQGYPFQSLQWLAGLGTGVGSQMGGTSSGTSSGTGTQTTTPPSPSPFSQILGGASGIAGLLGQSGAFAGAGGAAGAAGWMAPLFAALAQGGRVNGYADGGGVAGTLPEGEDTLLGQQDQLTSGIRGAQMFPNGTPELGLPEGMSRTETPKGVFHHDPGQFGAGAIQNAAHTGRENDVLNLGPYSKEDIIARVQKGEKPVVVVERTPEGTEVRAALGTEATAPEQIKHFEQTKSPQNAVGIEDLPDTLAKRQEGAAPGRAGGGVAPYGGVPSWLPGGGGVGYVPTMDIAKGSGVSNIKPQDPLKLSMALPSAATSAAPDLKSLGSLAGALGSGIAGMGGQANINQNEGAGLSASDENPSMFGRGGVVDYAEGGVPTDEFGPTYAVDAPVPAPVPTPPPVSSNGVVAPLLQEQAPFGEEPSLPKPESSPFGEEPSVTRNMPMPRPRPDSAPSMLPPPPTRDAARPVGVAQRFDDFDSAPRGVRNNNPGNVEDGPFARSLPGYAGTDGRFAKFDTPQDGQKASQALLSNYGKKGINTLQGAIERWAPASDGNDVSSYVRKVSTATGIDPTAPIDLTDPAVNGKVAQAMFQVENGTGKPQGERAPPAPAANGVAAPPPSAKANGVDWGPDSKLWPSLATAGFGMMASRSPYPGVAIGEGGLAGTQMYQNLRQQEQTRNMSQQRIDLEAKRLGQTADQFEKTHGLAQKSEALKEKIAELPYSGRMTMHEQKQLFIEQQKLDEAKRQHDLALRKPEIIYDDKGKATVLFPKPGPDGVEYWRYDPNTNQLDKSPIGKGMPGAAPGAPPGPGVQAPQGGATVQPAAFKPGEGLYLANQQVVEQSNKSGGYDYAGDAPYVEKGMQVPEPQPISGRGPDAIKIDAEKFLQTGALPKTPVGNSPVARQQAAYAHAVQNYGTALAASRGMSPTEVADAWRSAPGMLRFIMGPDGRATVSLGTAVRHLDTLAEYAKAWNAGDERTINRISATLSREFGGTAATNLETVAHIVGPEIVKAIGVAGAGTGADREGMTAQFTTARSYPQVMGAVVAAQKLMGGQLEGKERQAEQAGVSKGRFKSLIGERPYEILSASEKGQNPLLKPSMDVFVAGAKKANPGMSEDQLREIYKKKYGQ